MPLADLKRFGNFEISSNCTWIIFGTCLNICSYCLRSIFTKFFTCPGHVLRYLALVSELFLKIWSVLDMSLTGFRSSRCLTFRLERMGTHLNWSSLFPEFLGTCRGAVMWRYQSCDLWGSGPKCYPIWTCGGCALSEPRPATTAQQRHKLPWIPLQPEYSRINHHDSFSPLFFDRLSPGICCTAGWDWISIQLLVCDSGGPRSWSLSLCSFFDLASCLILQSFDHILFASWPGSLP